MDNLHLPAGSQWIGACQCAASVCVRARLSGGGASSRFLPTQPYTRNPRRQPTRAMPSRTQAPKKRRPQLADSGARQRPWLREASSCAPLTAFAGRPCGRACAGGRGQSRCPCARLNGLVGDEGAAPNRWRGVRSARCRLPRKRQAGRRGGQCSADDPSATGAEGRAHPGGRRLACSPPPLPRSARACAQRSSRRGRRGRGGACDAETHTARACAAAALRCIWADIMVLERTHSSYCAQEPVGFHRTGG